MKITPLEIRQKTFEIKFRGYEKEEVDAFLQALSFEWERMTTELKDTKSKLDIAERDVQKLREVESSLYKALKTAEDTSTNMVEQANKTAQLHLKEAQMDAEMLLNEAKKQARNLLEEAEEASKSAVEIAKYEIKKLEQDYNSIANQRENLLHELKNLAADTLERASRYLERKSTAKFEMPKVDAAHQEELLDFSVREKKEPIVPIPKIEEDLDDSGPAIEKIREGEVEEFEFEVNTSFAQDENDSEEELRKQSQANTSLKSDENEEQSSFFDQI